MFNTSKAFSSFSINNLEEAIEFYQDKLGIEIEEYNDMGGMFSLLLSKGNKVMIYPKGEDHVPANFTVLNFSVTDVEKTVDQLVAKGIKMEVYDGFNQDEKGISRGMGPTLAWFKDPAGNVLSILEEK